MSIKKEMFMWGGLKTILKKDKGNISGKMETSMKENLSKTLWMEKEYCK